MTIRSTTTAYPHKVHDSTGAVIHSHEGSTAQLLWTPERREGEWGRSIPIAMAMAVTIAAVAVSVPMPACTEEFIQWLSLHRCLQHLGYAHSCHFPSDALGQRWPCTLQESML